MSDRLPIAWLVDSISSRTAPETSALVATLLLHSWPGGPSDRTVPNAREWVRRWGPARRDAPPLDCSCPAGHCSVCN